MLIYSSDRHLRRMLINGSTSIWIGLNDKEEDMTFVWEDGTNLDSSESDWNVEEPNNWIGLNEACVSLDHRANWKWNDEECDLNDRVLCERPTNSLCHLFL